jgi:hypothetical protein
MHDIDRTQLETGWETENFESDGEFELYDEAYGEAEGELYGEMDEGVFDEVDEMELAADLLEITDEAELDLFLGNLIKKAGRAIGGAIRSPLGRSLGGMLKGIAKKALPMAGGALGNLIAPGAGGAMGSKLASAAGGLFGLELEGMSAEDQEFEVARRFVRLAGEATKNAAQMPPSTPPATAAQNAVAAAAQQHAPGLLRKGASNGATQRNGAGASRNGTTRTGRWVRRGRKIIVYGA